MHAPQAAWLSKVMGVAVGEEVEQAVRAQFMFEARVVGTLGQPDAVGLAVEQPFMRFDRDAQLTPNCAGYKLHVRQKAMRGAAGYELKVSKVGKHAKAAGEIATEAGPLPLNLT
jgi:hypothetical protein